MLGAELCVLSPLQQSHDVLLIDLCLPGWLQSLAPSAFSLAGNKCYQGRISPYSIAVTGPADIQAAIKWAVAKKVKVSIKNTGAVYYCPLSE